MNIRSLASFLTLAIVMVCAGRTAQASPILEFTSSGVLGPVLSGSDLLAANGKTFSLSGSIDEAATPTSTTSDSATFTIQAGDLSGTLQGFPNFTTTAPASLTLTVPGSGNPTLTISFNAYGSPITAVVSLLPGSITSLAHPLPFTPSPQTLTQPASNLTYCVIVCSPGTQANLGLTGTTSSFTSSTVPEPGTVVLLSSGLLGLLYWRRRKSA